MVFTTVLDPAKAIFREYKLTGTPETFLIDGDGMILKHIYAPNWTSPPVLSYLSSLVHKQEVARTAYDLIF
jgi:hypothetical protein